MSKDTKMTVLEFYKDEPATHPQLGCSLPYTDVIVYLYPEKWRVTEYGVDTGLKSYKPGMTRKESIVEAKKLFLDEGFTLKRHKTTEADYTGAIIMDALMIQP